MGSKANSAWSTSTVVAGGPCGPFLATLGHKLAELRLHCGYFFVLGASSRFGRARVGLVFVRDAVLVLLKGGRWRAARGSRCEMTEDERGMADGRGIMGHGPGRGRSRVGPQGEQYTPCAGSNLGGAATRQGSTRTRDALRRIRWSLGSRGPGEDWGWRKQRPGGVSPGPGLAWAGGGRGDVAQGVGFFGGHQDRSGRSHTGRRQERTPARMEPADVPASSVRIRRGVSLRGRGHLREYQIDTGPAPRCQH